MPFSPKTFEVRADWLNVYCFDARLSERVAAAVVVENSTFEVVVAAESVVAAVAGKLMMLAGADGLSEVEA